MDAVRIFLLHIFKAHLLWEMREANKSLQFERDDLKQKLADAQGDIKVLSL